jgi:hypothetical protein
MFCRIVHRGPALLVVREEQVCVHTMVKVKGYLVLFVEADALLQLCIVPKFTDVLLFLIPLYDLSTYLALGRVPIALNSMRSDLSRLYHFLAIGAQHGLILYLFVTLYL